MGSRGEGDGRAGRGRVAADIAGQPLPMPWYDINVQSINGLGTEKVLTAIT